MPEPGNVRRPRAESAAAFAFLLMCVVASTDYFAFTLRLLGSRQTPDEATAEVHRFAEAARMIPLGEPVGYLMDRPYARPEELDQTERRYYQMAQYAIAPAVVHRSADLPLLLANFRDPASLERWRREPGYELLRDFGGGVALFARKR